MIILQLPIELKRLIERNKAYYGLVGEDEDILKKIIPMLEDEDIIKLYDELCEEENKSGSRPEFEKYREEILEHLDDTILKAEIIRREQYQSSKPDIQQRNYTYISEFTTLLDKKVDKKKIIKSFYNKIKHLEAERELLNTKDAINNIELSIHIYQCIIHISEKLDIDLVLYRGPKFNKNYKKLTQIDIKKLKRRKYSKRDNQIRLQNMYLNQNLKRINDLKLEKQRLRRAVIEESER